MDLLTELVASFDPHKPNFRPTELYNEGWLLRLVLSMAASHTFDDFPLSFMPGASWFSEALLPTVFRRRSRSDKLAESRTSADAVLGHFSVGGHGKADLSLAPQATQFVVVEAKLHSPLSPGTRNAPDFDQAARNVACIAEVLHQARREPDDTLHLGFVVLAPAASLPALKSLLDTDSIRAKVAARVSQYGGKLDRWEDVWFAPTLAQLAITPVSWEDAIEWVAQEHAERAASLGAFYSRCLQYNEGGHCPLTRWIPGRLPGSPTGPAGRG
jgi:hypothetical protein